jgi:putative endonuclease
MNHCVYIVRCSDGTFYTGYTTDVNKRVLTHNDGRGAKYTRVRLPVKLVYFEHRKTKSDALKREFAIKKLSRQEKINLIDCFSDSLRG